MIWTRWCSGELIVRKISSFFLERNLRERKKKYCFYKSYMHVFISSSKGDSVHVRLINLISTYVSLYCFLYMCFFFTWPLCNNSICSATQFWIQHPKKIMYLKICCQWSLLAAWNCHLLFMGFAFFYLLSPLPPYNKIIWNPEKNVLKSGIC